MPSPDKIFTFLYIIFQQRHSIQMVPFEYSIFRYTRHRDNVSLNGKLSHHHHISYPSLQLTSILSTINELCQFCLPSHPHLFSLVVVRIWFCVCVHKATEKGKRIRKKCKYIKALASQYFVMLMLKIELVRFHPQMDERKVAESLFQYKQLPKLLVAFNSTYSIDVLV